MHYQGTPQAIARRYGYDDWPSYFWARVDQGGGLFACWPWTGGRNAGGYGTVSYDRHTYRAHRLAWMLTYGAIPDGLLVCHRCDTPPCCNPAHLFLGTTRDNATDRQAKGRNRPRRSHLTEDQVLAIRRRYAEGGVSMRALARAHAVSRGAIGRLLTQQTWHHVAPTPSRQAISPIHGMRMLNEGQVRAMRARHAEGTSIGRVAREFGVGYSTAYDIVRRKKYKDVE